MLRYLRHLGRVKTYLLDRGWNIAIIAALFYAWVSASYVVYGDNAEFAALARLGGVAHPSGYPLYTIWLRAFSWLPGSPAHAAALATTILGVSTILVLHAACRAWGARPTAASIAVGAFALSPVVLRLHSEAEVFALNGLVVALVLWLAAKAGPARGTRRVALLALVAGLGLSNHMTCVLVAPVGVLGVVHGFRESRRGAGLVGLVGIGAFVVGVAPYLYLYLASPSPASWSSLDGARSLVDHALRFDYGGPWSLSGRKVEIDRAGNLWALASTLGRAGGWVLAPFALAAMTWFTIRTDRAETRVAWCLLLASWLLAGPILTSRFNIVPRGLGLYVVERFHLLPLLLLVVPLAVGLDRLAARVRTLPLAARPGLRGVVVAAAMLVVGATSLPALGRTRTPEVEEGLANMLRSVPPGSVIIGASDEFHFGTIYLQAARGLRPDVAIIVPTHAGLPDYRERIEKAYGIRIDKPSGDEQLSVQIAGRALATGRPVFVDGFQANIVEAFPSYPYGILFRILPAGSTPPPLDEVLATNKRVFEAYTIDYVPGTPSLYHRFYARTWSILARAAGRAGRREDEAFAQQMAARLGGP